MNRYDDERADAIGMKKSHPLVAEPAPEVVSQICRDFGVPGVTCRRVVDRLSGVIVYIFRMPSDFGDRLSDRIPLIPFRFGLDLNGLRPVDRLLEGIDKCPNLSHLDLSETLITDVGVAHLAHCPDLSWLNLDWTGISGKSVRLLANIGKLSSLFMASTRRLKSKDLEALSSCRSIVELDIGGHEISARLIAALCRCAKLEVLTLSTYGISQSAMERLRKLKQLKSLSLHGPEMNARDILLLSRLNHTRLNLNTFQISDKGLRELSPLKSLKRLDLNLGNISDDGMKVFESLTELESLAIGGASITDCGLKELTGLPNLSSLILRRTQITDAGIQYIARLRSLSSLDLAYTAITNIGLQQLTVLASLKTLNVKRTKVTEAGVNELRAALPNCEIGFTASNESVRELKD